MTSAVGVCDLRADGRRQAEAHRAHAARGEPQPRRAEVAILRGPHLMLPDARGDDRLALGVLVDLFDDVVRLDERAVAVVIHRVASASAPRAARASAA